MNQLFKIVLTFLFIFSVSPAFAQWDIRGCSDYGVDLRYPQTLESSLWTFRSTVWDGYVDFQENNKYWTHWGYGTWSVTDDGQVRMANDYNDRVYFIRLVDHGFRFEGVRNDGLRISGKMLCAKYQGPPPTVPEDIEKEIRQYYNALLDRVPFPKELDANFREYNLSKSLDTVKASIMATEEYQAKVAAAEAAARLLPPPEDQLGW